MQENRRKMEVALCTVLRTLSSLDAGRKNIRHCSRTLLKLCSNIGFKDCLLKHEITSFCTIDHHINRSFSKLSYVITSTCSVFHHGTDCWN